MRKWTSEFLSGAVAVAALFVFVKSSEAGPITSADVVYIVDESGSMSGEHAFLQATIDDLDAGLAAAGVATRQYGVVGFGGTISGNGPPRDVSTGLQNLTGAKTALDALTISGGFEDGWAAIDYALNSGNFAYGGDAINFILVTDEDRDDWNGGLTFDGVKNDLLSNSVTLNAIVNVSTDPSNALGVAPGGTTYIPDGSGGFTTQSGGSIVSGSGTTVADYADLALPTGGAVWDLNKLRGGGLLADSFAAAFVDIKVQEIITPGPAPVPEPMTLTLLGVGLLGLGFATRRRSTKV